MAGKEIRTDIVLKARTEGLKQAQQQAEDLSRSLSQAAEKATKGFAASQDAIQKFSVSMSNANRMGGGAVGGGGGDGGFGNVAPIVKGLDDLKKIMQSLVSMTGAKIQKEQSEQSETEKRSFTHGFLQSALPSTASAFLSNTPGMGRQALGQLVGSGLAGIARGIGSMPLSGIGGLSQALMSSNIPGGSIAGGALNIAAAQTESAIAREHLRLQMEPLLRTIPFDAKHKTPGGAYGQIRRLGLGAGMAETEATQFVGGILSSGGGHLKELEHSGLMGPAFAAKTAYGIEPGTIGMLLRAARHGGISGLQEGAEGSGGKLLVDSIAQGMKLGLSGSDTHEYVQTIAQGIESFKTTGIPLNRESLMSIQTTFGNMGMGPTRALSSARSMTHAIQSLSTRGPRNAEELMLLQTIGGFSGGSAADFEKAQLMLEQSGGKLSGETMKKLFARLMQAGGGGATGRSVFRNAMRSYGVSIGVEETQLMEAQMNGTINREQQARLDFLQREKKEAARGAPRSIADIQGQAAKAPGLGLVSMQASITNQKADMGLDLAKISMDFERQAMSLAATVGHLAKTPLKLLVEATSAVGDGIVNFKEHVTDLGHELSTLNKNTFWRMLRNIKGDVSGVE